MPPTPREIADTLEAAARRLHAEGKHEAAVEVALACIDALRAAAAFGRLTVQQQDDIVKRVEHSVETRSALSKKFSRPNDLNMIAARAKGIPSLRGLAKALGCSASFLSQVAKGDRPMPADKAAAFKKLTGKDWR